MNIIAITDIHGRKELPNTIIPKLQNADMVVIAGDITNFGGYDDARTIINVIRTINEHIIAIPGNCDRMVVNKYLIDQAISLHMETRIISDLAFYGIGGSGATPFHTPQEYTDRDIKEVVRTWQKHRSAKWHILVTHSPPAGTKLDRTMIGLHVGSRVIRSFIEEFQPDLVICGHIHEGRGADCINNTVCINPGPFPKHYALITLDNSIGYELF